MSALARVSHGEDALAWQVRVAGLPTPVREHRFDTIRRWRFDLAWIAPRLAVEVEGGIWTGGRHVRGAGYERDLEKYNAAAIAGWLVLRVTTAMVDDGRALAHVADALAARGIPR